MELLIIPAWILMSVAEKIVSPKTAAKISKLFEE